MITNRSVAKRDLTRETVSEVTKEDEKSVKRSTVSSQSMFTCIRNKGRKISRKREGKRVY